MEIGLIYSKDDPRQAEARDFVHRFIKERGILANVTESEQPVSSPTVIIDGHALKEERSKKRSGDRKMFPSIPEIARALEQHAWSL